MAKKRVGVIGIGSIAHMFHLENYRNHPDVELVAVADTDKERADKAAADFDVPRAYGSAEEMFASEELDAVSICTFNQSHVPLALLALKHGVDVLLEKPMAMNVEEALSLKGAAAESGRVVMVGMSHRYRNDAQVIHAAVQNGELGEIYFAKTRILRRRGVPLGWFTASEYSGGGPMMDIGVHVLDLAWWLMGCPEPDKVVGKLFHKIAPYETDGVSGYVAYSHENKEEGVYDVEDLGTAYILFKNGAVLTVEASWAVNGSQDDAVKVDLFGSKGGASLEPLVLFKDTAGLSVEHKLEVPSGDFYKKEIDHFVQCVISGRTPLSDVPQGTEVIRMLEAIRVSSETNDIVKL
ncbi:Gfo/Idh/MocA family protein [Gorillibacterium timonense]|uniref:Gfo/Idh/MocA family protein n=1 Tax=Gorillibacterium timonense TaxID=1689269 RepID=UPI00071CBEC1|nr:Gfo/Idh/MocA family oxidoreductase [Gorillibacterium timonense]